MAKSKGFRSFNGFSSGVPMPEFKGIHTSQQEVDETKAARETAKNQFQFTRTAAKNYMAEVAYRLKTHKTINGVRKFLVGVGLAAKSSDQGLELTEHKGELGSQALDSHLEASKQHAAVMFDQKKQEIAARFEERKQKRLSPSNK